MKKPYIPKRNGGLGTYVYLYTLYLTDDEFAQKAKTYSQFNSFKKPEKNSEAIQNITVAVNMLEQIANNEEAKEKQAISNYIEKIRNYLEQNENTIPPILKKKLTQQISACKNYDFKTVEENNLALIQNINIIRQDLNTYLRRINQIGSINENTINKNATKKIFEYRIQKDTENFLMHQHQKNSTEWSAKRDQRLWNAFESSLKEQIKNVPEEFKQELFSALFIDFNNWVENNPDLSSYNKISINPNNIQKLVNQYIQAEEGEKTHFLKLLEANSNEVIHILQDLQNSFHSTFLSGEDYKELQMLLQQKKNAKSGANIIFHKKEYTQKQVTDLLNTYNNNQEENIDKTFSFTFHTKTSHGNFYEIVATILHSAINVSKNVAADIIAPIGTVTFSSKGQKAQNELLKLSRNIENIISTDFEKQKELTLKDFNEQIKTQKKVSGAIQKQIQKSIKNLNNNDLFNNFFITHESFKLYKGMEEGIADEFHGRKMNALSALAKLYSSSEISNGMIDSKMLLTYLINIDSVTLAGPSNKEPLETYLSLFAGLLMFDDIASFSTKAINSIASQIPSSSIQQLHVYNLGGVYFPVSIILKNIIQEIRNLKLETSFKIEDTSNIATVSITGPRPTYTPPANMATWSNLANSTISGTKIQIAFLAGYSEYIKGLFNLNNIG